MNFSFSIFKSLASHFSFLLLFFLTFSQFALSEQKKSCLSIMMNELAHSPSTPKQDPPQTSWPIHSSQFDAPTSPFSHPTEPTTVYDATTKDGTQFKIFIINNKPFFYTEFPEKLPFSNGKQFGLLTSHTSLIGFTPEERTPTNFSIGPNIGLKLMENGYKITKGTWVGPNAVENLIARYSGDGDPKISEKLALIRKFKNSIQEIINTTFFFQNVHNSLTANFFLDKNWEKVTNNRTGETLYLIGLFDFNKPENIQLRRNIIFYFKDPRSRGTIDRGTEWGIFLNSMDDGVPSNTDHYSFDRLLKYPDTISNASPPFVSTEGEKLLIENSSLFWWVQRGQMPILLSAVEKSANKIFSLTRKGGHDVHLPQERLNFYRLYQKELIELIQKTQLTFSVLQQMALFKGQELGTNQEFWILLDPIYTILLPLQRPSRPSKSVPILFLDNTVPELGYNGTDIGFISSPPARKFRLENGEIFILNGGKRTFIKSKIFNAPVIPPPAQEALLPLENAPKTELDFYQYHRIIQDHFQPELSSLFQSSVFSLMDFASSMALKATINGDPTKEVYLTFSSDRIFLFIPHPNEMPQGYQQRLVVLNEVGKMQSFQPIQLISDLQIVINVDQRGFATVDDKDKEGLLNQHLQIMTILAKKASDNGLQPLSFLEMHQFINDHREQVLELLTSSAITPYSLSTTLLLQGKIIDPHETDPSSLSPKTRKVFVLIDAKKYFDSSSNQPQNSRGIAYYFTEDSYGHLMDLPEGTQMNFSSDFQPDGQPIFAGPISIKIESSMGFIPFKKIHVFLK